jgi:hypothetical protein
VVAKGEAKSGELAFQLLVGVVKVWIAALRELIELCEEVAD